MAAVAETTPKKAYARFISSLSRSSSLLSRFLGAILLLPLAFLTVLSAFVSEPAGPPVGSARLCSSCAELGRRTDVHPCDAGQT